MYIGKSMGRIGLAIIATLLLGFGIAEVILYYHWFETSGIAYDLALILRDVISGEVLFSTFFIKWISQYALAIPGFICMGLGAWLLDSTYDLGIAYYLATFPYRRKQHG